MTSPCICTGWWLVLLINKEQQYKDSSRWGKKERNQKGSQKAKESYTKGWEDTIPNNYIIKHKEPPQGGRKSIHLSNASLYFGLHLLLFALCIYVMQAMEREEIQLRQTRRRGWGGLPRGEVDAEDEVAFSIASSTKRRHWISQWWKHVVDIFLVGCWLLSRNLHS